jgi:hypothetical protein
VATQDKIILRNVCSVSFPTQVQGTYVKDVDRPEHPPIEGDSFSRVTIYVGNECCTNWTSYVYCCLKIEECRIFFYTDQTLKIKKIQNKICYITAMLNVYLFCSHKDTFCWKIKGIPQHLDLEKCMTDQLLWALIRRASWPCAHPLSGPTSCTSLKESMLSFPSMKTMSYFWTRKKCQLSQYWIAFKILK